MRTRILMVMMTGIGLISGKAMAQTDDVLIFDNQTNDFLLPSYFDTPATTGIETQAIQTDTPPQNVPADIDILNEIFGDQAINDTSATTNTPKATNNSQVFYPTPKSVQQAKAQPLLTPLAPLPQVPEATIPPPKHIQYSSPYVTRLLAKENGKSKASIQLPKDIRLQFNSGATQLTDPAVKWISAYALHVKKDPTQVVTLRVSSQDWNIQQARLGIIMQILFEKGLPTRQIRIFQSNRDADSVIIGAETDANQTQVITPEDKKRVIKEQKTLVW